jgi:hypothetical protein
MLEIMKIVGPRFPRVTQLRRAEKIHLQVLGERGEELIVDPGALAAWIGPFSYATYVSCLNSGARRSPNEGFLRFPSAAAMEKAISAQQRAGDPLYLSRDQARQAWLDRARSFTFQLLELDARCTVAEITADTAGGREHIALILDCCGRLFSCGDLILGYYSKSSSKVAALYRERGLKARVLPVPTREYVLHAHLDGAGVRIRGPRHLAYMLAPDKDVQAGEFKKAEYVTSVHTDRWSRVRRDLERARWRILYERVPRSQPVEEILASAPDEPWYLPDAPHDFDVEPYT